MSDDRYVWDDDFNSFFELNADNNYVNLSKVTVVKILNEQDQRIKDLERELAEARENLVVKERANEIACHNLSEEIEEKKDLERQLAEARKEITDAMDSLDCDSIAYIILKELKEKGDE